ncbi:hypothetical protein BJF78_12155 [Pseudonocardia sp. CNS-139]|nr:hypothetical protein BJF78_12155 [Pseudonocardia sp. CNS-139]
MQHVLDAVDEPVDLGLAPLLHGTAGEVVDGGAGGERLAQLQVDGPPGPLVGRHVPGAHVPVGVPGRGRAAVAPEHVDGEHREVDDLPGHLDVRLAELVEVVASASTAPISTRVA